MFEEYRVASRGWNRGGSLRKSLEEKRSRRQHSKRDAAATGALASRRKGGQERRRWRMMMVRSKELAVFRGVNVRCVAGSRGLLEGLARRLSSSLGEWGKSSS